MDTLSLHFIRPYWLLALPVAVLLPLLWRRLRRAAGDWARVCDPHLLRWLSVGEGAGQAAGRGAWLAALAWLLAAMALAGPSLQKLPDSSFASRNARVLVLDLSASMLAQDLKPNRLTQVRYRLSDMLGKKQEGQMGLVAYAGDAFVVSPLTSDTNTIRNMLPALQPDVMPAAGSRPDRALELAAKLLQRAGHASGEILLIADSGSQAAADVAASLADAHIITSVLAVGTAGGAPVPSGNGFLSDSQGNVVIAKLQREALKAIARAGAGQYTELATAGAARSPWAVKRGTEFARKKDDLGERWKDSGPWLLLLILPLAALGFRRGLLFLLPLWILPGLLVSGNARAGLWDDLWLTRDQQAEAALAQDRAADAAALAADPAIAGEAAYRAGEYKRAGRLWSQLADADADYNRGNALARAGNYKAAIAAYDAALDKRPGMKDAAFNRDLVKKLQQQKEQRQKEQQQRDRQKKNGQNQQNQQGRDGDKQSGEQSRQGNDKQDADKQQKKGGQQDETGKEGKDGKQPSSDVSDREKNWSEEDKQAMEQWLRRIPDDPGGLLRRKFRYEYERRGSRGDDSQDAQDW